MTKKEFIKEIGKYTDVPNKFISNRIKNLMEKLDKSLDIENEIMYFNKWAEKAKSRESIKVISEIIKIFRRYINEKEKD